MNIESAPLFLNRPHCAVGPGCESNWAEPLGYVDTLGDARFLVLRTFVMNTTSSRSYFKLKLQLEASTTISTLLMTVPNGESGRE